MLEVAQITGSECYGPRKQKPSEFLVNSMMCTGIEIRAGNLGQVKRDFQPTHRLDVPILCGTPATTTVWRGLTKKKTRYQRCTGRV
jgi:hypothetical protein